jgi:hypothetical protein
MAALAVGFHCVLGGRSVSSMDRIVDGLMPGEDLARVATACADTERWSERHPLASDGWT